MDKVTLQTHSIHLQGERSPTYQLVEDALKRKKLLTNASSADWRIVIYNENIQRKTASLTSEGLTAQYELKLSIDYQILDSQQKPLRPRNTLQIFRYYNFNQYDVAASDGEASLLRMEIRSAASRQIVRQLQLLQR
ncbi:MAG: outer membrane lipopolysaccharide assembly protein LptE/RlpB [Cellvibrionaceae bacterium]|jgi:outer membrane lipopolysaccharide assembly protein LptE/RlpB